MKKEAAKATILQEWSAMPEGERDQAGAAKFALQMSRKYPFRCSGDRYQHIMGWLSKRLSERSR